VAPFTLGERNIPEGTAEAAAAADSSEAAADSSEADAAKAVAADADTDAASGAGDQQRCGACSAVYRRRAHLVVHQVASVVDPDVVMCQAYQRNRRMFR